jgi:hypothetical protein
MTDREYVLAKYPNAQALGAYSQGFGYKIYHTVGLAYVAMSATKPTEAEAWADAARAIRERQS